MTDQGDNLYASPQSPPAPRPDTGRFGSVVGWLAVIVTLAMIAILAIVSLLG